MAYETIKTEPAARGLVRYKVRYSEYPDEQSMWVKSVSGASQSDLDAIVDECITQDNEEEEKIRKQELESHMPIEARTI